MWIYLITNKVNGKQYVGQTTVSVAKRFYRHCSRYTKPVRVMPIREAINKYGKENFTIATLCECVSQDELNSKEIEWATKLNTFSPNGYNLRAGNGRGSVAKSLRDATGKRNRGRIISETTRQRMSEAQRGRKHSDSTKAKISAIKKRTVIPQHVYDALSAAKAKTFVMVSPTEQTITVTNLTAFCKANGLRKNRMFEVIYGVKGSYKGWHLPGYILRKNRKHKDLGSEGM